MVQIHPFQAFRPAPGLASRVTCPPYDVLNSREARALSAGNDASFLRVTRPEINLAPDTDEHADAVYAQGRAALKELVARGVLVPSHGARLWLYAQTMGTHHQVGLVACTSVDEYDRGVIKKHENTRPDKEEDRTRHLDTVGAHDEPVFLTYRAQPSITALVRNVLTNAPADDFVAPDAVRHTVWDIPDSITAELEACFAKEVPNLYVADGHHRSAAASRVHHKRRGTPGEHDRFLAVLIPDNEVQILAYNRLARDTQKRSAEELLRELRAKFDITPAARPEPPGPRSFGLYLDSRWYHAHVRKDSFAENDPVASLDCSLCQDQLLAPLFGITDPRLSTHVDFVGGIRGSGELERRVREEHWTLGITLYPTQIKELLSVSDADRLMPPKSTWFEPKLRSGLFVHPFAV